MLVRGGAEQGECIGGPPYVVRLRPQVGVETPAQQFGPQGRGDGCDSRRPTQPTKLIHDHHPQQQKPDPT
ncbi:hypothetical protein ABT300_41955, partial [Streptomyces sp. NPDC001027]|uniref:hypothetical protein n=1 Tax=Streptomyces sp. NPDC001027 TaxID=3154771 RepID=UPI00331FD4D9